MNWPREMIRNLPFFGIQKPTYQLLYHFSFRFAYTKSFFFDYLTKKNINICGFVFQIILSNFD